jgi:tetratricopeptide (TPR) repeat protein
VGQTLARASRWDLAALALTQALELEPNYVEALAYRGLALDQIGQDGLADLDQAQESVPQALLPHLFLAQHWLLQHDADRAVAELHLAQALEPSNPAVAAQLGQALVMQGDLQAAQAAYLQASALAPQVFEFQALLARFSLDHEMDVNGTGLPAARRAVLLDPGSSEALDLLGFSYYLTGNPEVAEHLLTRTLQLAPASPAAYYHLGLVRLALGHDDLAVQALHQAAALDPGGQYDLLATRALARVAP